MIRLAGILLGLAATAVGAAAAELDKADLAVRARATLEKYCSECHGKPETRTDLDLLDFAKVVDKDRKLPPFVKPKDANKSQIIELIEAGIMPPGGKTRPTAEEIAELKQWIDQGAPDYPRAFGEAFTLETIRKDVSALPPGDRPFIRYLSLSHLAAKNPQSPLGPHRVAIAAAIEKTSKAKKAPALNPVDPTATVLRFDIRSAGWEAQPFKIVEEKVDRWSPITIFDVVLLEYPHGAVPASLPESRELENFLVAAGQVRPIPHVRAEWLTQALTTTPIGKDVADLLLAPAATPAVPPSGPPLRLGLQPVPVPAIDGWYEGDTPPKGAPIVLTVETVNANQMFSSTFHENDRLTIVLKSDVEAEFEVVWVDAEGSVSPMRPDPKGKITRLTPNDPFKLRPPKDESGFTIGPLLGKERITAFTAKKPIPPGIQLTTTPRQMQPVNQFKAIERYFHHFAFDGSTATALPAEIVRRTVEIEIVKPKK